MSTQSLAGSVKNLAIGTIVAGSFVFGLSPETSDLKVYYGLMHAHTMISDGSGTPEEAYAMAKASKLDFFAETPHNHDECEPRSGERRDAIMIATNNSLYNGTTAQAITRRWKEEGSTVVKEETLTIKPLLKAAQEATSNSFVALYGQEFSTISNGNHMNVVGIDEVINIDKGDFKGLITLLNRLKSQGKPLPIIQFNHPDVTEDLFYKGSKESIRKNMFNDYGVDEGDLGPHFEKMAKVLNEYACLIEILSGPALTDKLPGNFKYDSHENDYYFYLRQGFRLSPSAGQDNHYKNWGKITDARMGILSDKLTQDALFTAIRNRRTFATEDKNLQATLYINDQVMGSAIKAGVESELKLNVRISDTDEPDAEYKVIIYGGEIEAELSTKATNWLASDGVIEERTLIGDGIVTVKGIFVSDKPSFYYVKVIQDGKDRLWTAPVWINSSFDSQPVQPVVSSQTTYYWTKTATSKTYHKDGCTSIDRIKADNLMSGQTPPAGRTQHECSVPEEDTH